MRAATLMLVCVGLFAGCDAGVGRAAQAPAPEDSQPAEAVQAAATRPAPREVMARVNGQPIYMDPLYDLLVSGPGPQFALELVRHEMVRQAARKEGVTVSDKDVKAEHGRFLQAAFPEGSEASARERALEQLLRSKQVSRKQWDMSVRTSALLRRMAEPQIKIGDDELREEFNRQHGRQVVISHIQTATVDEALKVKELSAKEDFAELAVRYSVNPSARSGGRLPPIGPQTEGVPPAILSAALAMKQVGEISDPVQVGTSFHILKLEEIVEPKKVKYEDVKDELAADVKERRIRLYQKAILERLIREARVEYVNPILKAHEDRARMEQGVVP